MLRGVSEVPCWETARGDLRFAVSWWHKQHKARRLLVLHVLAEFFEAATDVFVHPSRLVVIVVTLNERQQVLPRHDASCDFGFRLFCRIKFSCHSTLGAQKLPQTKTRSSTSRCSGSTELIQALLTSSKSPSITVGLSIPASLASSASLRVSSCLELLRFTFSSVVSGAYNP